MGLFKDIVNTVSSIFKTDPSQFVENEQNQFTVVSVAGIAEGLLTKEQAVELKAAENDSNKKGEALTRATENSIKIKAGESPERDGLVDDTIARVEENTIETKPVKELENSERAKNGKAREERIK